MKINESPAFSSQLSVSPLGPLEILVSLPVLYLFRSHPPILLHRPT